MVAEAAQPIAVSIPQVGWSEQDPPTCGWRRSWPVWTASRRRPRARWRRWKASGCRGRCWPRCFWTRRCARCARRSCGTTSARIAECAELLARCPDIGLRTNGTPDPGITAPKLLWLRKHEPEVMDRARMLMLTKDYVRLALTGELASEPTDAGGTQLLDCRPDDWDPALCAAGRLGARRICRRWSTSWAAAGGLRPDLAARWGMRAGLPVAGGCGRQHGLDPGRRGRRAGGCGADHRHLGRGLHRGRGVPPRARRGDPDQRPCGAGYLPVDGRGDECHRLAGLDGADGAAHGGRAGGRGGSLCGDGPTGRCAGVPALPERHPHAAEPARHDRPDRRAASGRDACQCWAMR